MNKIQLFSLLCLYIYSGVYPFIIKSRQLTTICPPQLSSYQNHKSSLNLLYLSKKEYDKNRSSIDNEFGKIHVQVTKTLPNISSPNEARNKWLSYVWHKGGGLAAFVITQEETDNDNNFENYNYGSCTPSSSRRLILPIFMEESLLKETKDENESDDIVLKYKVTNAGLFSTEIIQSSHLGTVQFSSLSDRNNEVSMIWNVTFDVKNPKLETFWNLFTERMIADASNNFVSSLATPIVYTRRTRLHKKADGPKITPETAMAEWVLFCWKDGAGMPLPPPIIFDEISRMIVPPFLREKIVSQSCSDTQDILLEPYCELKYTVDNPGIATYQVHSHIGRVRFISTQVDESSKNRNIMPGEGPFVDMIWEVEVRPYHNWSSFIKTFTRVIITSYAKNFKRHIEEGPDAMVSVLPPRGQFGGEELIQIRKDSWLGGVLMAHLNDKRSVFEQAKSSLQPWTWSLDDGDGESDEFNEGYLS